MLQSGGWKAMDHRVPEEECHPRDHGSRTGRGTGAHGSSGQPPGWIVSGRAWQARPPMVNRQHARSGWYDRAKRLYPNGAGALFTFAQKAGYEACIKLVNSVELFSHVANLGDARSLIIHSASTTHRQLTP